MECCIPHNTAGTLPALIAFCKKQKLLRGLPGSSKTWQPTEIYEISPAKTMKVYTV